MVNSTLIVPCTLYALFYLGLRDIIIVVIFTTRMLNSILTLFVRNKNAPNLTQRWLLGEIKRLLGGNERSRAATLIIFTVHMCCCVQRNASFRESDSRRSLNVHHYTILYDIVHVCTLMFILRFTYLCNVADDNNNIIKLFIHRNQWSCRDRWIFF